MRAVVQRVSEASVTVDDETIGQIGHGLLVLLGIGHDDDIHDAETLASKSSELRIFTDDDGKMNRSLLESGGEMLAVSQFTLFGDCRKGRRPSFVAAAPPQHAEPLYEHFIRAVSDLGIRVATGKFGADMQVSLVNHGPVTLLLDSTKAF